VGPEAENRLLLGRWTISDLDHLLQESSAIKDAGERIDLLSRGFLGVDYKESTLVGDINTKEVFVVNLEGVDCMTFIEYMEAMRLSRSFSEFIENLKKVRYHLGRVSFEKRNHFFTDWIESNSNLVQDATAEIGGNRTISVRKRLNLKKDGGYIIQGIPCKDREIKYIPLDKVDDVVMDGLKTGDYVGMYSREDGLDVSHVGIIIKAQGTIFLLRHASSLIGKVVDEDFKAYLTKKDGLVILRPWNE